MMYETEVETDAGVFLVNAVVDMKDRETCFVGLLTVMKFDLFTEDFEHHVPTPKERSEIESKVTVKYFSEVFDE